MIRYIMQDMAVICYDGNANNDDDEDDDVSNSIENTFLSVFSLDHLVSKELRSLKTTSPSPQKSHLVAPWNYPPLFVASLIHWGFRGASCDKIDCWRLHPQETWTIHGTEIYTNRREGQLPEVSKLTWHSRIAPWTLMVGSWKTMFFFLEWPIFNGHVSCREGICVILWEGGENVFSFFPEWSRSLGKYLPRSRSKMDPRFPSLLELLVDLLDVISLMLVCPPMLIDVCQWQR